MSFLGRIFGGLAGKGGASGGDNAYYYYLRCNRCGEKIRVRVDRANDLAQDFEGGGGDSPTGYSATKGVVGKQCFRVITMTVKYDSARRETGRSAEGAEFITAEEYEAD